MRAIPINRTDYCQFLTISQTNYSLTYYAEHARKCSHDVINRFLDNEKYTPSLLWEHIKGNCVIFSNNLIFLIFFNPINGFKRFCFLFFIPHITNNLRDYLFFGS